MKIKKYLLASILLCLSFFIKETPALAAELLEVGTYTTNDGKHTITIASDNSVLYDDAYSLTLTNDEKGGKISGKIGTNKKAITFYQLNSSKIISPTVMNYTHGGETVYLYDYTVFSLDKTPVVNESGAYELWRSGSKVNTYADLQSAIDAATSKDTIKLNKNVDATSGAYIKGKELTIEGNNHTINGSTWLNSIFVIEENASLKLTNITIDGGSTGFKVNYEQPNIQTGKSTSIPIIAGSDTSDIKLNISPIVSKGNLVIENSKLNNNYVNGNGGAVNIVSGNFTTTKSSFNHNRSSKGGALYIGSNFKIDQTDFTIKNIVIDDCELKENYSSNGGAIFTYNVEKFDIKNSNFIKNTVTGGKGGTILISNQSSGEYYSMLEKYNLDFTKFNIDNCLFEGNWVGNDGAAIENHEAVLTIKNTTFRKNVGVHSSSSCGTISYYMDYPYELRDKLQMTFDNCLFEENLGSASTIADHGSSIKIDILNTKFIRNKATYNSVLLYSSDTNFKNVVFEDEYVSRAVVDVQSYIQEQFEGKPATITFENVQFKGTKNGSTDILIRRKNADYINMPYTVVFNEKNTANIELWNENNLVINGEHTGVINLDPKTPKENLVIGKKAVINDEININENKILVTLIYQDTETVEGYNWEARKYLYVDEKAFTKKEFFLEHQLSKEGYELKLYTDSAFTTEWDYVVSSANVDNINSVNIYGRWEQHAHVYEGFAVYKNAIHEQCECGYLGKKLSMKVPNNLVYDGKNKPVTINNELNISSNEYTIDYYMKDKDGKFRKIDGEPVKKGTYKVVLTYKDMSIEEEYSITEKAVNNDNAVNSDKNQKEENVNNPDTSDNIISTLIVLSLSLISIVIVTILYQKNKNKITTKKDLE